LRPAVLSRRRSFGCHSDGGCRFVERMLTVVQTLRPQERRVIEYLADALAARRQGLPAPQSLHGSRTVTIFRSVENVLGWSGSL
jgi:hypothetical protein